MRALQDPSYVATEFVYWPRNTYCRFGQGQLLVLSTPTKQDFALVWQYDDVVEGKDV